MPVKHQMHNARTQLVVRIARLLHAWSGAILASFLILISLSGTALIWKDNYLRLIYPQATQPFENSTESITKIALSAEGIFEKSALYGIDFGDEEFGLSRVILLDGRGAYLGPDGSLVDTWAPNGRPEDWLIDLHHRLLRGTAGLYTVGFVAIASLVMILAGLIAFWPSRRSWPRGIILRGSHPSQMRRSHRTSGIVFALPILLVVFSGIVLTFPTISRDAMLWPHALGDTYGEDFGEGVDDIEGPSEADWPRVIERAQAVFPNATITGLRWPAGEDQKVVLLRHANSWSDIATNSVFITTVEGYMDLRIEGRALPFGERVFKAMRPLHTARVTMPAYNIFLTIIGLGLVYLCSLGLITFMMKRIKNRK